jgi:hypothetical protein
MAVIKREHLQITGQGKLPDKPANAKERLNPPCELERWHMGMVDRKKGARGPDDPKD